MKLLVLSDLHVEHAPFVPDAAAVAAADAVVLAGDIHTAADAAAWARRTTAPRFADDPVTAAFGSHLPEALIARADLWVHGHTHASRDYRLGAARVVCNPRGYPRRRDGGFENPDFDPALVVEVGAPAPSAARR